MSVRKRGAQSSYPRASEIPNILRVSHNNKRHHLDRSSLPIITFVTGNKKKLEEVKLILSSSAPLPFVITNKKIDLPELQGDPIDIAIEKCKIAAKEIQGPVFTEDTSLCFNALNGLPGPYIKWFLEKCGHQGLNNLIAAYHDKSAYAQTIVAFTPGPGKMVHVFDGKTDGDIVLPRGSLDFGWDPIFQPHEGFGKTYAEMSKEEKNKISHRSRSLLKFQAYLLSSHDDVVKEINEDKR
jgi:inosine triphosphate pyrophosphatase